MKYLCLLILLVTTLCAKAAVVDTNSFLLLVLPEYSTNNGATFTEDFSVAALISHPKGTRFFKTGTEYGMVTAVTHLCWSTNLTDWTLVPTNYMSGGVNGVFYYTKDMVWRVGLHKVIIKQ